MRSSPLVLLLLIGVQAVLNMGGGLAQSAVGAANHKVGQRTAANHRAGQQRTDGTVGDHLYEHSSSSQDHRRNSHYRTKRPHLATSLNTQENNSPVVGPSASNSQPDPSSPVVDPKLFSKRRYRSSPRVVFSEVLPSHDALEGEGSDIEGFRGARVRRMAESSVPRGEYSVCESRNLWVTNMTRATDMKGNEVTVLSHVTINNVVKKQCFYETLCLSPEEREKTMKLERPAGGRNGKKGLKAQDLGCRGIDKRSWNSYCTNTHVFVSALTTFEKRTAWRYIRINGACVCVISKKWGARKGH